jgi:uncharacterized protein YdeI (YjbR/CyaY-like superfamily)
MSIDTLHKMPTDFREALKLSHADAAWDSITPLARNEWICWITSAKKPETRMRRIERACSNLLAGIRRPCCWPGCPHRKEPL